jgi:hypothetical protein
VKKTWTILTLTLAFLLALTVGCEGRELGGSSTTVAPSAVALEAAYTIEGDTLTIVPAAATGLATAVYRRVAE